MSEDLSGQKNGQFKWAKIEARHAIFEILVQ